MEKIKQFEQKYGYRIAYVLSIIFISIVSLYYVDMFDRVLVVDDEFAYWGIAAQIAGYDWSGMLSVTGYYSFGYSIILVPFFWLVKLGVEITVVHKLTIVLNAIFLILSFMITVYIGKKVFPKINKYLIVIMGATVTLYTNTIAQAGCAWTETYLYFMFWFIVLCVYKVIVNPNWKWLMVLLLSTANLFVIHMRSIGVVIAVGMILAVKFGIDKKINIRKILGIILFVGLLALVIFSTKWYVETFVYVNNAKMVINDFVGQTEKISLFFSLSGMVDILLSFLGKLYYMGVASWLFAFVGAMTICGRMVSIIKLSIKNKKIILESIDILLLFFLLAAVGELMVSAVFKTFSYYSSGEIPNNPDYIIYGRYADFIVGPLILIGFSVILDLKRYIKEIICSILLLIICTIAVQYQLNVIMFHHSIPKVGFRPTAIVGILYLFKGVSAAQAYYAVLIVITAFVACLIVNTGQVKNRRNWIVSGLSIIVVGSFWCYFGMEYARGFASDKIHKEKHVESVAELIQTTRDESVLYFIGDAGGNFTEIKILQWLCPESSIHLITLDEMRKGSFEKESIFLSESMDYNLIAAISDNKNFVYNSGVVCVYTEPGSEAEVVINEKLKRAWSSSNPKPVKMDLSKVLTDLSYQKYNGSVYYNFNKPEGYITWRTGIHPVDGNYEFTIDMEIGGYDGNGEIGYITVSDEKGSYTETRVLNQEDFGFGGKGKITVQAKVENYLEPVVGVYTYGNCSMKINNIDYRQVRGNIILEGMQADYIKEKGEIVTKLNRKKEYAVCYVDSDSSAMSGFPDFSRVDEYFPNGITECVPGKIVPYKENLGDRYVIVENTGDHEAILTLLSEYIVISKNQGYTLLVPDNFEMREIIKDCGYEILADGKTPIDIRFFYGAEDAEVMFSEMREICLPRGRYEVLVEFTAEEMNNINMATIYLNGKEQKITREMLTNNSYKEVYELELTQVTDNVKIGLFSYYNARLSEEKIGIRRIDRGYNYQRDISLYQLRCKNVTCYEDRIMTDFYENGEIIYSGISLEYGQYKLRITGQLQEEEQDAIIKIYRNGEMREEVPLIFEREEAQMLEFVLNEYEPKEWSFEIISPKGNQMQIFEVEIVR